MFRLVGASGFRVVRVIGGRVVVEVEVVMMAGDRDGRDG